MSLLSDIQTAASQSNTDLPSILRKCLILAHELQTPDLKNWAIKELNRYDNADQLPDYRIIKTLRPNGKFRDQVSGKITPSFGFADFAPGSIPEGLRTMELRQSVAELQSFLQHPTRLSVSQHEVDQYAKQLRPTTQLDSPNLVCTEIGVNLLPATIRGLLDSIRTRIVLFTVELKEKFPNLDPETETPTTQQKAELQKMVYASIYNINLTGSGAMLAIENAGVTQTATINPDPTQLFSDVIAAIKNSQESQDAIARLTAAVEQMRQAHGTPTYIERYQSFMSTLADHAQLFQVLAPYLPLLAALLPS
jgi:hypothetical protein